MFESCLRNYGSLCQAAFFCEYTKKRDCVAFGTVSFLCLHVIFTARQPFYLVVVYLFNFHPIHWDIETLISYIQE